MTNQQLTSLLVQIFELFCEQHGRKARTAGEAVRWALNNEIITNDEYMQIPDGFK